MKEEINSIKNLLYSGQKINVDLAISIMDSLGLTWDSKGFEEEKELIDLYGNSVFYKTYLDLSYGNPLESLPESMGRLQKLESLDLGDNQLSTLPESISQLQNLEKLYLNDNQLRSLPASIGQLQNLEVLWLGGNKFNFLPTSISQLQKLKKLDLGDNQLSSLPAAIGQLQQLKTLWLEGNPLSNTAKEELRKQLPNTIIAF